MAGVTNSYFEQFQQQPMPCGGSVTGSSWALWLLVGLILGSLTFQKRGTQ